MRSGTSFFNRTIFFKTVTRFWPVWAVNLVPWLIILPLSAFMALREPDGIKQFALSVGYLYQPALLAAVALGVLTAMAVFSHLYSSRSANFFGCLPVRREGLFLCHYLAGLAMLWVPNLLVAALTALVELAGQALQPVPLLFWLGYTCGSELFFYSFAVFCGMFTGHLLALPIFYCIFNGLASFVYQVIYAVMDEFYYGFSGMGNVASALRRALTPVDALASPTWTSYADSVDFEIEGLLVLAAYSAAGLALAAVSFLLYRRRRLESAGDVVAVRPMRPVFKYGVAVCAGLAFGYLTAMILGLGEWGLMVAILLWAVAGCFVAQMLLDKTFRVFRKWRGAAAVAAAFCVMFAVIQLDLTGFETRVPSLDQVLSVEARGFDAVYLSDSGDYVVEEFTDPEHIALILDLHRAAVEQRDEHRENADNHDSHYTSLDLTYHLKSGGTMSRNYAVYVRPEQMDREGSAAWALEQLYADRELYWDLYDFDLLHERLDQGGRLSEVRYYTYDYYSDTYGYYPGDFQEVYGDGYAVTRPAAEPADTYAEFYFYGADAQELLEAVEADYWDGKIGRRSLDSSLVTDGTWYLSFTVTWDTEDGERMNWMNIAGSDRAERTQAVLARLFAATADES